MILLVSACSSGIDQADLDAANQQASDLQAANDTLRGERDVALAEAAELASDIAGLDARITELEEDLADELTGTEELEAELRAASAEREAALAEVESLLLAYDPEIQAAKARISEEAIPLACSLGTQAALDGGSAPSASVVISQLEAQETIAGFEVSDLVDEASVLAEARRCFDEAKLDVALYGPHGNGFFTVGVEIGPGLWRSTGTGDGCYWARLNSNQGILDNHFGNAGGTVRIRSTDFEVEFDDCGTWEYVGA